MPARNDDSPTATSNGQQPVPQTNTSSWDNNSILRQSMAVVAAGVLYMAAGTILAWFFPVNSNWGENGDYLAVAAHEMRWIQSLAYLGAAVGTLPGHRLADHVGRKAAMLGTAVVLLLGWVLIAVAHFWTICAGRFLHGVAAATLIVVVFAYTEEIAEKRLRKPLYIVLKLYIAVGDLLEFQIGQKVPYTTLAVMSFFIPLVHVFACYFIPETPLHLLTKGKTEEARLTLQWLLHEPRDGVQIEMDALQEAAQVPHVSIREFWATADHRNTVLRVLGLQLCQLMSGIVMVYYYKTVLLKAIGSTHAYGNAIVWIVLHLALYFRSKSEACIGRRRLLIYSALGMAVSQALVAIYFHLKTKEFVWLGIIGIFCYIALFFFGFGPVTLKIVSESLPSRLQRKAHVVMLTTMFLITFLIVHCFYTLREDVTCTIFAISCVFTAVYVCLVLPEPADVLLLNSDDDVLPESSIQQP